MTFCREMPKRKITGGRPEALIVGVDGGYSLLELSDISVAMTVKARPYIHCLILKNVCAEITLVGHFGTIIADKYRIGQKPQEEDGQHVHHTAMFCDRANIGLILGEKIIDSPG